MASFSVTFCTTLFLVYAICRSSSAFAIACSSSTLRTSSGGALYGAGMRRSP
eukprot:CAMPEP_0205930850 /NCGR_PEP_ID=MMETSP1325-20131115/26208_1 /ASSEMBLY_ACC=CAM_ASM_000708 /TAXON_ID=236786 /ORGANISM="Florenciella sp., Strain RCC1007" /LENGTH=51 /DNA_ID=CAMNT_0053300301 /DNA_START=9 /DNA_END=161 /DNA_ORIENTATION=+